MPHASGGGSHGGGCHGGGGRGSMPSVSRHCFHGARRFRYYGKNGAVHYVYSKTKPQPQSAWELVAKVAFVSVFIVFGVIMFFSAIIDLFIPFEPIYPAYMRDDDVYIEDKIGVIDNEEQLSQTLAEFRETTGITPYVITVYDSDWKDRFKNLEAYSYNLYVSRFSDEGHFVVAYSEPENAAELDFVDWSWEGMQGYRTDDILTEGNFGHFQRILQDSLCDESVSVGQAFNESFDSLLEYIVSGRDNLKSSIILLIFSSIWTGIIVFTLVSAIREYNDSHRIYTEDSND